MKKVYRIQAWREYEHMEALYNCAAAVFEIPSWEVIRDWLRGGQAPELPDKEDTPHRGAAIGLLHTHKGVEGVYIETDGRRRIFVTVHSGQPWSFASVVVEFPLPGSVLAAGELIRHAWRVPYDNWAEVTFADGTKVDLDDYPGPVGRDLYRARRAHSAYRDRPTEEKLLQWAKEGEWGIDGQAVTKDNLDEFLEACADPFYASPV